MDGFRLIRGEKVTHEVHVFSKSPLGSAGGHRPPSESTTTTGKVQPVHPETTPIRLASANAPTMPEKGRKAGEAD